MKTINYSDFETDMPKAFEEVSDSGEIVRVVRENGKNFVIMEEVEYNILRNAMHLLLAASVNEE